MLRASNAPRRRRRGRLRLGGGGCLFAGRGGNHALQVTTGVSVVHSSGVVSSLAWLTAVPSARRT